MTWWGEGLSRRDLEAHVGDLRQVADIQRVRLDDGPERQVQAAQVWTGSGLTFTVLLDRAMDIGAATYNGIPLAWQSGTGAVHPSRYEPEGLGWLRTFHGGLLALCGLTHAGVNAVDDQTGEHLGLHGRVNNLPVRDIRIERLWDEQPPKLRLSGVLDEAVLFGYRLRLERTLEVTVGQPGFTVRDRVRNMGGLPAPLMILYHCNFGYPLVSPDSVVKTSAVKVVPRDAVAALGLDRWSTIDPPTPGYAEQVFFHEMAPNAGATAILFNQRLSLGVRLDFATRAPVYFTQWKQLGFSDYVMGLEPGNCLPEGRVEARRNSRLQMLKSDETASFELNFSMIHTLDS